MKAAKRECVVKGSCLVERYVGLMFVAHVTATVCSHTQLFDTVCMIAIALWHPLARNFLEEVLDGGMMPCQTYI